MPYLYFIPVSLLRLPQIGLISLSRAQRMSLPYDIVIQVITGIWAYYNPPPIYDDWTLESLIVRRAKHTAAYKSWSRVRWTTYVTISLVCKDWRGIIQNLRWKVIFLDSPLDRTIYSKMIRSYLIEKGEALGGTVHQRLLRHSRIHAHACHPPWSPDNFNPGWDPEVCQYTQSVDLSIQKLTNIFGSNRIDSFRSLTRLEVHVQSITSGNEIHRLRNMSRVENLRLTLHSVPTKGAADVNAYLKLFPDVQRLTLSGAAFSLAEIAPHTQKSTHTLVLDFIGTGHNSLLPWAISRGLRSGVFKKNSNDSRSNTIVVCGLSLRPVDFEYASQNCANYGVRLIWEP